MKIIHSNELDLFKKKKKMLLAEVNPPPPASCKHLIKVYSGSCREI